MLYFSLVALLFSLDLQHEPRCAHRDVLLLCPIAVHWQEALVGQVRHYYAGALLSVHSSSSISFASSHRVSQIIQFVVDLAVMFGALFYYYYTEGNCHGDGLLWTVSITILSSFLFLFVQMYRGRYKKEDRRTKTTKSH